MNIKEAKMEVEKTVKVYLEKDENGEYRVPLVRQRPLFLVGAPGIGKTAIMEQVAEDLDLALVSYSMTHHTRQSAIGLPYLKEVEYGGKKFTKSEYTMSGFSRNSRNGRMLQDRLLQTCRISTTREKMPEISQQKLTS